MQWVVVRALGRGDWGGALFACRTSIIIEARSWALGMRASAFLFACSTSLVLHAPPYLICVQNKFLFFYMHDSLLFFAWNTGMSVHVRHLGCAHTAGICFCTRPLSVASPPVVLALVCAWDHVPLYTTCLLLPLPFMWHHS